ncbi:DUF5994 family protein [Mycobacterium kansasii]|uniref:Uncharacterized protein n=3 Tax=Mycobacterium kansasii TaxID=1768 RepID=A0A1V3XYZ0_MYCKA|nr:DUF5994 family protein [Mycobacterium kansasii]EUA05589.1 hypothetical protein I547_1083 [Mycobacterium kansasii 824]AGZ52486.1 hypothetical protein MKAN_20885 [Mycobacterium kansasii ATCC 12478]ARG55842.1 hypothetical protein B1T43_08170 [Mycobacterium kansasii]ARG61283.1 hypothetical protein B1T45_08225 [Mycobacterium kansasii]ARG68992.1 hypothetical protein B1T47_08010 [Mycobacterium kansasii]
MERETRLQLKTFRPVSEHIDGAWWPRSRSLADELPGLVAAVSERLGPIAIVGYRHNGWDETPSSVEIDGHSVELLGFTSDEPTSVILIGEDGHHVTLRVISPDVGEQSGRQALDDARSCTDGDVASASRSLVARSVADVADKLARHEGRADEQRTAQIRRWSEEAAEQFVDAPVQTFVPILVEHIVRNRMLESRAATASPLR